MAGIFAIVPVKPIGEGKSRLGSILGADERVRLNTQFMVRTFASVEIFPGASRSIVVSRSDAVLADAAARGLIALKQESGDLNAALAAATRKAMSLGASGVFVLPVDLPLASERTVERIAMRSFSGPTCLLVADRHGFGTNFMLLAPAADDLYRFGPDSFRRHRAAAAARGYDVVACDDADLALDIDEPADYELWRSMKPSA